MSLLLMWCWLAFAGLSEQTSSALPAEGVVTAVVNGDVACYVTFTANQKSYTQMADFSLCEKKASLIGKPAQFTYRAEKVMADECQGDPDCKKTKTVNLIVRATVVAGKSAAPAPPAASTSQTSFCTPMETVVFACRTGKKLVSVCASKDLSPKAGYVQYRFGDPAEPLEMTLPEGFVHPSKAAYGATESFSGGGGAWLRFRNGKTGYVVYTGIGKWGRNGATLSKAGIVVEQNGKQAANLSCSTKETSELGPDWFDKAGIKPNPNEFFDFPGGGLLQLLLAQVHPDVR